MSENTTPGVDRRSFLRTAGLGALAVGAVSAVELSTAGLAHAAPPVKVSPNVMENAGAGMHSTASTASLIACATIARGGVSCGVTSGPGTDVSLGGFTGVFIMEMWAQTVDSYMIDNAAGVLKATGTMRSVTKVGGVTLEDVLHPYLAVGIDGRGTGSDEYHINFITPFWNPTNPMASPSEYKTGWVAFGGAFLVGAVNVTP